MLGAASAALALLSPAPAAAVEVCYLGGPLLPGFQLNGDAVLDGIDLVVTQSIGNQRSSVMYVPKFSATRDFHVELDVIITQFNSGGADGIAFVMHNDPAGPSALGKEGGGIGYQELSNSVVVEFDTYMNGWDPSGNHIAITRNGDTNHGSLNNAIFPAPVTPPGFNLKDGKPITLWIDYDHESTRLEVFAAPAKKKPNQPMMAAFVDLGAVLGSSFYVGFTGSTGGSWSKHEVPRLLATDVFATAAEACCADDNDCIGSSLGPVCDPVKHLCGQCTVQEKSGCGGGKPACAIDRSSNECGAACDGDLGAGTPQACSSPQFPACWPGGTCASCGGDAGTSGAFSCPAGAPFCSPTGHCGRCTKNTDCAGQGPEHAGAVCNQASGACVDTCEADADCGAGNVCDPADKRCGLADGHGPCSAGTAGLCRSGWCAAASGVCMATGACQQDGDCAPGGFCDGDSFQCTPKLGNGALVPSDALHPGCSGGAGAAVCQSGVCDPADGRCGLLVGNGECLSSLQCRSGLCLEGGANDKHCGACSTGNDCPAATPVCDPSSSACVPCTSDRGVASAHPCPSAKAPFCTPAGACSTCSGASDCAGPGHAGPFCDASAGSCGLSCTKDTDCPARWCDNPSGSVGAGSCQPLVKNDQPLPASVPIAGFCTPETGERTCESGVCEPGDNRCGLAEGSSCVSPAQCRIALCEDGICGGLENGSSGQAGAGGATGGEGVTAGAGGQGAVAGAGGGPWQQGRFDVKRLPDIVGPSGAGGAEAESAVVPRPAGEVAAGAGAGPGATVRQEERQGYDLRGGCSASPGGRGRGALIGLGLALVAWGRRRRAGDRSSRLALSFAPVPRGRGLG